MEKRTVGGIYIPLSLWMCGNCRSGMEITECSVLCELDPEEKIVKPNHVSCDYFDITEQELQYYRDGMKDDTRGIGEVRISGISGN